MSRTYTRRDILIGVLAAGTISSAATFFSPGGRPSSRVELTLLAGDDPTGALKLLIDLWNRANPQTHVNAPALPVSTTDQMRTMIGAAETGSADILALDIINIPYFQSMNYLTAIDLSGDDPDLNAASFISSTLLPSTLGDTRPNAPCWAVPFTANAGMLFRRTPPSPESDTNGPSLATTVDTLVPDQSHGFVGQLNPSSSASDEALLVNIMEHAISRNLRGFQNGAGKPAAMVTAWQGDLWHDALEPLQTAIGRGRVTMSSTEDDTKDSFFHNNLAAMRNWPVYYRELQQNGDAGALTSAVSVDALPTGVLGGQSLGLVRRSPNAARAMDFMRFLVSDQIQRILVPYGTPPVRVNAYDPSLKDSVPHLVKVRGAVEGAALRPITPKYQKFSEAFIGPMKDLVLRNQPLPATFEDQLESALA